MQIDEKANQNGSMTYRKKSGVVFDIDSIHENSNIVKKTSKDRMDVDYKQGKRDSLVSTHLESLEHVIRQRRSSQKNRLSFVGSAANRTEVTDNDKDKNGHLWDHITDTNTKIQQLTAIIEKQQRAMDKMATSIEQLTKK